MSAPESCPRCGKPERVVGVEVWPVYDGVLYWRSDCCAQTWHRFAPGSRQYQLARAFVADGRPSESGRGE